MATIDDDGKRAFAAQLRMEAAIKLYEAALVLTDGEAAEQQRQAAHEQLDMMLDAKTAAMAGAFKRLGGKP